MKLCTVRKICVMFCVNHLFAGTWAFGVKRKLLRSLGYEIGAGTRVVGPLFCTGSLRIGRDCWIGRDFTVNGNGTVVIGDRCDIAPSVMFLTGGHEIGGEGRRAGKGEAYTIQVRDGAWIGARTTVLRNVTVGRGSVIAACACVVSDIPDNTLAGGVPAKVIRELSNEPEEISKQ